MTKEVMTIHQALCELKTLDLRISKKLREAHFAAPATGYSKTVLGLPTISFVKNGEECYQSITDLIRRRTAIKNAVILSNANTSVEIGGEKYKVAEAIDLKTTGMSYIKRLHDVLKSQIADSQKVVSSENGSKLEKKADDYILSIYGNREISKNISDEIETTRREFIKQQEYSIVQFVGAENKLKALDEFIDKFFVEIDSALSVSNALTKIEIEY